MDWSYLGHATWLAEAAGLRLLFDPLLDWLHHGGVFEVAPWRTVHDEALRADFLFVSHRHPDHFDVRSLRRLAALDADTVVITPDPLVESCARRLGFRTVRNVAPLTHVELDGVRFVTTPSVDPAEWGAMVACDEAVVWNQVDSVHASPAAVRETAASSLATLGARDVTLALARWHPLLEVDAMLAGSIGFPYRGYADTLEQIAAIGARAIVPGAAGAQHAGPFDFMNRLVYPVPEARFLRDVARRLPGIRAFPATIGDRWHVAGADVEQVPGGARELVTPVLDALDPRRFSPLAIEPLRDPNLGGRDRDAMSSDVARWVAEVLAPALVKPIARLGLREEASLVLEVVFPYTTEAYTLLVSREGTRVERRFDDDYDALVSVAGSMLCDVIEGTRHWGDPLLAGMLRGCTRAYQVDEGGVRAARIAPIFLYYALSYEESVVRATEHEVATG